MTPEEFRRYGHAMIDFVADYRANLAARPVMAQVKPGETRSLLPSGPPEIGEPMEQIFADLERIVLPGLSHFQHPRFFGYFPANSLLSGVLADLARPGWASSGSRGNQARR